jgi:hypothetical protein
VIDEHAGELVAHGVLHQGRGDRGVDPTGQSADRALAAELRPHRRDRLVEDLGYRPARLATRDLVQELFERPLAERGVHDFGVVLHAGQ